VAHPADHLPDPNLLASSHRHRARSQVLEDREDSAPLQDHVAAGDRLESAAGRIDPTVCFTASAASRTRWTRARSGTPSTAATTWPSKAAQTAWPQP
jgi:hypothetical protein